MNEMADDSDLDVIQALDMDLMLFGVCFRKTNADGSWTRLAPEEVFTAAHHTTPKEHGREKTG